MEPLRVLLVEDNPGDILLIREFLGENSDCRIDTVPTLGEAIRIMEAERFDVVLLDLNLPDSSGLETVQRLVSHFPETAILVLTCQADERIAARAIRYGAQDYLDKCYISPRWLGRAIANAIERKRAEQRKNGLLADLTAALEEVEMLRKMVPVCMGCRRINQG